MENDKVPVERAVILTLTEQQVALLLQLVSRANAGGTDSMRVILALEAHLQAALKPAETPAPPVAAGPREPA